MNAEAWDRSVGFGVAGVVLESILWLMLLGPFVHGPHLPTGTFICLPLGVLLGVAAFSDRPVRGRHRRLGKILGGVAVLMGLAIVGAALILAIALLMSMGDNVL